MRLQKENQQNIEKQRKKKEKKSNKIELKRTKRSTQIFSFKMYYTAKSSIFISSKMSKHLVSCMIISYLSAAGGCAFPCLPDVVGRGTWEPTIGFCNGFRAANISANVGLNFESLQCKRVEFNHQKM